MGTNLTRTYNNIARHQSTAVLSTTCEQKHLLHYRSHCRHRHRPQSAPLVLARGLHGEYGYKICLNSSPARWSFSSSNENKISCDGRERASQNRYAVISREICSRHVARGPYAHVVCAASRKRLPVAMYHASAFRSRVCHRNHVCVFVWTWLNLGELPRFDNQMQHLAALSLYLVDLAHEELLKFADIKRDLANTFRGLPLESNRPHGHS
jgi:hypothetical protein